MPGDVSPRLAWIRALAIVVSATALATSCTSDDRPAPRLPQRTYVIAAVGDIACDADASAKPSEEGCRPGPVARAVESIEPDRLLLLGDIQYPSGAGTVSYESFDRWFGGFRSIWAPTPGDAEWEGHVEGYFDQFGAAAGPPGGYYSFELGAWHVLALNSQDCFDGDGCGEGTEQYEWLLDDLDRHPAERFPCTLAFWHDPRFMWVEWWRSDDGPRGPVPAVRPLWDALDDADAELTLGGNAHNYERWISQDVSGAIDPARPHAVRRRHGRAATQRCGTCAPPCGAGIVPGRRLRRARTATPHRELPMAVALGAWGTGVPGRGNRRLSLTRSHAHTPDPASAKESPHAGT